jgi:hypothetical protein
MKSSKILKYKRGLILAFAVASMLYSCSTIRVLEVDSPSADCAGSGQHFCHDTTITTSLWKGRNNKQDLKSLCPNGISRVKVTTKPMDVILGFITAGFVVKQRLDWDCAQRSGSSAPPR